MNSTPATRQSYDWWRYRHLLTPVLITAPYCRWRWKCHKYLHSLIKRNTDQIFIRSVDVVFSSCLLSLLMLEFLEYHWRFNLLQHCMQVLPVVLEQQVVVVLVLNWFDQIESVVDARLTNAPWTAAWAIISTSQITYAYSDKLITLGKSWIVNSNLIWNKQFHIAPETSW